MPMDTRMSRSMASRTVSLVASNRCWVISTAPRPLTTREPWATSVARPESPASAWRRAADTLVMGLAVSAAAPAVNSAPTGSSRAIVRDMGAIPKAAPMR